MTKAPCTNHSCHSLPSAFVRLRYFFGKRLGVADFLDEQLYHTGKHRFHNMHLHGRGILCGLGIAPMDTTLIRVLKGAAIDRCGHEIVVGSDQCIDVDAWYQRERISRGEGWPSDELVGEARALNLCVVVRYVECAISPEPAPRDPCSCDDQSCENGRIREGFELRLMLQEEADALFSVPNPLSTEELNEAIGQSDACSALARLLRTSCPEFDDGDWIRLGCIAASLNEELASVVDVATIDDDGGDVLFSTEVQQEILCQLLQAAVPGSLGPGPVIDSQSWNASDGTFDLHLSSAIEGGTVGQQFSVATLAGGSWGPALVFGDTQFTAAVDGEGGVLTLRATDPSELVDFFVDGGRYQLTRTNDVGAPIVNEDMESLRPLEYQWRFMLADEDGTLNAVTLG